jgi:hypothetical protein
VRIATITNWAYGATVCLTIASGIVMLMASNADTVERQAVCSDRFLINSPKMLKLMPGRLSDLARLYVVKKEPQILSEYRQKERSLQSIETRLSRLKDNGATLKSWRYCMKG